jgi:F-type H+-transporting ATPase subunit b
MGVLAFLLAKLLYKPVRNFLQTRAERIRLQLTLADEANVHANELKRGYENELQKLEREKSEILGEARKQAAEASRQVLAEAKLDAEAIKARALATAEMERLNAQEEMRKAILEISAALAEKIIAHSMTDEKRELLYNEAIDELRGTTWQH